MPPSRPILALALTALAAALAGCDRGADDDADASTAPAEPSAIEAASPSRGPSATDAASPSTPSTPAVTTPPLRVTAVDLGRAVGADNRVTTAASTFDRDDTVYVSVATEGSVANVPVTARWLDQDGQVVDTETRNVEHAGPAVTAFRVDKPDGWPGGRYRVQVSVGDQVVQTREFTVQ